MGLETLGYDPAERAKKITGLHHKSPGNVFMGLQRRKGLLVAPGVYCAIGAQIARQNREALLAADQPCSYDFIYSSGWAISAMLLANPDMGLYNTALLDFIGTPLIQAAYPMPVIMDAEAGFGSEVQLVKTVELFDRMGVAVGHLEDQAGTRRCGNLSGKRVVEPDVMEAKIYSWLKTTHELGSSMRLMVRTDALTAMDGGINQAIDRMKRYLDVHYLDFYPAISWADAMMKPEHIEMWCRAMEDHNPNVLRGLNYSPNKDWGAHYRGELGREHPPTYEEMYDKGRGFHVQWHTILQARASFEAVWKSFHNMAVNGASELWDLHDRQRETPYGDTQGISNFPAWMEHEMLIGGKEAQERYERSRGYGAEHREAETESAAEPNSNESPDGTQ